ncbi:MAG: hypothetical protein AAFS10_04550 [Myxococcota bacterium]
MLSCIEVVYFSYFTLDLTTTSFYYASPLWIRSDGAVAQLGER